MSSIHDFHIGDVVRLNSTGERRLSYLKVYAKIGTAGIVIERNYKRYDDASLLKIQYRVIFQGFPDPIWVEPWTIDKIE